MSYRKTIKYSFLSSVPVMAGYVVLGIGFGILLNSAGYSWPWALAMSVFIYAGSMQYVGVSLLSGGASLITGALMTVMVNIRHLFYGIAMIDRYRDTGASKPYLIFALTDETFSLVCSAEVPKKVDLKKYYLFTSAFNQCYWVFGSFLGALMGSGLNFNSAGIEFSMTALFTVIFTQQWEQTDNHLPAILGAGISLVCLVITGPSGFLIPSMILITIAMFAIRRLVEDPGTEGTAETAEESRGGDGNGQ